MNNLEDMFDDDKLNKAVKKGKRKNLFKNIFIGIIAFIIASTLNDSISGILGEINTRDIKMYTKISIPNGYISKCVNVSNFLGGTSYYTVCKDLACGPVILSNEIQSFGFSPFKTSSHFQGIGGHSGDSWPIDYWDNGYKKLMFFHPDIKYKEYKKDFKDLDDIPEGKIIEMGLSLDKKYSIRNFSTLIPKVNISWLWLDTYTKEQMDKYKKDAKEHFSKSCYIPECKILGIRTEGNTLLNDIYDSNYSGLLNRLEKLGYKDIYNHLKGRKIPPEIIGAIVYGTKSELKTLINNPHIKGATIGIMRDKN